MQMRLIGRYYSYFLRLVLLVLLPKDLAAKLSRYKVARYQVSRRILRMNRCLKEKLGECVAEQRGYHWALTSFAVKTWGDTDISEAEKPEAWH